MVPKAAVYRARRYHSHRFMIGVLGRERTVHYRGFRGGSGHPTDGAWGQEEFYLYRPSVDDLTLGPRNTAFCRSGCGAEFGAWRGANLKRNMT